MEDYFCPLCKQEVSKQLFEKITGIWQEKEKHLRDLKQKEKVLLQKEKELLIKVESEKKKFVEEVKKKHTKEMEKKTNEFRLILDKEKKQIIKEKEKIKREYEKRISVEVNNLLSKEKEKNKQEMENLKNKIETIAKKRIDAATTALQKEKVNLKRKEQLQMNRYTMLNKQFASLQNKSRMEINKREQKIKSLEEQITKNQTPSVLGLLEEKVFLEHLRKEFPQDRFEHVGKGGDIIQYVIENNKIIGTIVYELKKVSIFNKSHIEQTVEAKQKRNADFGILVTNAKRGKEDFGLSTSKGVIIIHPAGALVIAKILRDQIVAISKLSLSQSERNKTIKTVIEYIQSPSFKNGIENIINSTIDLYNSLKKEVKDHINVWENRINKYRKIYGEADKIELKVVNLFIEDKPLIEIPKRGDIQPIELPSKII